MPLTYNAERSYQSVWTKKPAEFSVAAFLLTETVSFHMMSGRLARCEDFAEMTQIRFRGLVCLERRPLELNFLSRSKVFVIRKVGVVSSDAANPN